MNGIRNFFLLFWVCFTILTLLRSCQKEDRVGMLYKKADALFRVSSPKEGRHEKIERSLQYYHHGLYLCTGKKDPYFDDIKGNELAERGIYGLISAYSLLGKVADLQEHLEHTSASSDRCFIIRQLLESLTKKEQWEKAQQFEEAGLEACESREELLMLYLQLIKAAFRNAESLKPGDAFKTRLFQYGSELVQVFNDTSGPQPFLGMQLTPKDRLALYYTLIFFQQDTAKKLEYFKELEVEREKINESIRAEYGYTSLSLFDQKLIVILSIILLLGLLSVILLWTIKDLEKQKESQTKARILKEEELKKSIQLLNARREERKRISHALHDEVGSRLTLERFNLKRLFREKDELSISSYIDRFINEVSHKIKSIVYYEKEGIANSSLAALTEEHCRLVRSSSNIPLELYIFGVDDFLNDESCIKLALVIKTVLDNAVRHAQASRIEVSLNGYGHELNIIISDNGCGIGNIQTIKSLQSDLEERMKDLHAKVSIDSKRGEGTSVIIEVPALDHEMSYKVS